MSEQDRDHVAAAVKAGSADTCNALGKSLAGQNRHQEALAFFDAAVAQKSDFADAYMNRGRSLQALNRPGDAAASYDRAIAINPGDPEPYKCGGDLLLRHHRYDTAMAFYERAAALKADYAAAFVAAGDFALHHNRLEPALAFYDRALVWRPNDAHAQHRRATTLRLLKRYEEALESIDRVLALDPAFPEARGDRLNIKKQMCSWDGLEGETDELFAAVRRGELAARPFSLLVLDCPPDLRRDYAKLYAARKYPAGGSARQVAPRASKGHDKIRVAYLSANFAAHPVAQLLAGVIEHHDRTRFEPIAVSLAYDDGSPMYARLRRAFAGFVDVAERSDAEAAEALQALDVDIAVDLMGYTKDSRTGIFALRPAPVQVNFLGMAATTGAPYIDYLIADRVVIPPENRAWYTEKLVYLPDTFMPTDDRRFLPERRMSRQEAGLPGTGFVFCSFNLSPKFTPETFAVWMRLLSAVEGSVLWLPHRSAAGVRNLSAAAEANGVDPRRIVFAPFVSTPEDHWARLTAADLFLDSLPFGGHSTACDALWVGVPVLTCLGEDFPGRVAASLLRALAMPELVTHTLAEYEARALELARTPSAMATVREKLMRHRKSQPLFDTARYTRHLEAAFEHMHAHALAGEAPTPFAVEA
jgi:predicted O-linked N-acetylglucosamine transferase (SPINDLY family)